MLSEKTFLIAFVANNAWSIYNFRIDIIRSLLKEGHRIAVLSPPDEFVSRLTDEGCQYYPIQFDNRSLNPMKDIRLFFSLKKLYQRIQPDLIFHYVAKPNIYGSMAANSLKIPSIAVVTGLGYAFAKQNWLYHFVKLLYKRSLGNASEVWFLNNEDAQVFHLAGIVSIAKIKILPGEGVNTGYFQLVESLKGKPAGKFRFIMACRLLKSKGVGLFAEACRILKRKGYVFEADLLGFHEPNHPDGIPEQELLKWQAEGLINYRGFSSDVRAALANADCFVFPSYYHEGVPRCLMEAASMELPIVTTRNRGCREVVIDEVTGFLCSLGDPFDLAEKMEQFFSMPPAFRDEMGKKGRELVLGKFDIKKIQTEYFKVITDLLHRS